MFAGFILGITLVFLISWLGRRCLAKRRKERGESKGENIGMVARTEENSIPPPQGFSASGTDQPRKWFK
jgi:hypothetical protein